MSGNGDALTVPFAEQAVRDALEEHGSRLALTRADIEELRAEVETGHRATREAIAKIGKAYRTELEGIRIELRATNALLTEIRKALELK